MRTLLAACSATFLILGSRPAQAQGTARLSGRVQDAATSRPLIAATVTLGARATRTDETGAFAFTRVAPGTYQLMEMIETYSASADRSGTLAQVWPRGMPCADTGMPQAGEQAGRDRQSNIVRWIVVWMKH